MIIRWKNAAVSEPQLCGATSRMSISSTLVTRYCRYRWYLTEDDRGSDALAWNICYKPVAYGSELYTLGLCCYRSLRGRDIRKSCLGWSLRGDCRKMHAVRLDRVYWFYWCVFADKLMAAVMFSKLISVFVKQSLGHLFSFSRYWYLKLWTLILYCSISAAFFSCKHKFYILDLNRNTNSNFLKFWLIIMSLWLITIDLSASYLFLFYRSHKT